MERLTLSLYYRLKPYLPRRLQISLRRFRARIKLRTHRHTWPIDEKTAIPPKNWNGWPGGKKFALVLTHDVDTAKGQDRCPDLIQIEQDLGFTASYNFVPERYKVDDGLRNHLTGNGFEVGVHGLNHDGLYFTSEKIFRERKVKINRYLKDWKSVGFRTPSMLHNLDWLHGLDIKYDSSTFDTDPFEPQPDGVGTIYPFWVPGKNERSGYVEIPYTLPQDFLLFILLKQKSIDIWKRKLDWIADKGGMALMLTHPDYMNFDSYGERGEEYPVSLYEEFLEYVQTAYNGRYWHALPREVARHFRQQQDETATSSASPTLKRKSRNIRACMLAYTFYESDARVMRYAKTLAAMGNDVDVIALRGKGQSAHEIVDGVHVYRIQERIRNEKRSITYASRILLFTLLSTIKLSRLQLQRPYDIVHVHNIPDFLVFAAWLPKLMKSKILLDIHDLLPEFYQAKFGVRDRHWAIRVLKFLEKASARFANHVIAANDIWGERLITRSVPGDRCSVILNYPDTAIFSHSIGQAEKTRDGFKIVYPGSLNWHQGLDIAIRALPVIRTSIPEARLHIYGDGKEKVGLKDLGRSLGVGDAVVFHDRVSLPEVAKAMADADVGIVPKRADGFGNEAFSTKILEFMSVGVPVVASETRIERYYFDDSLVTFFESGDYNDLARAVVQLYKDHEIADSRVQRSRHYVMDNNWGVKKEMYLKIIDKELKGENWEPET